MQLDDGGFVIAWRSRDVDGSFYAVMMRSYDADGTPRGDEVRVNQATSGSQTYPDIVALSDGRFVLAWESDGQDGSGDGIYARIYNANGTAAGSEFRVNTTTANDQKSASIAATPDGGFVVVWYNSNSSTSTDIRLQAYDSNGQAVGSETIVGQGAASFNIAPEIVISPDGIARLIWYNAASGSFTGAVYVALSGPSALGTEAADVLVGSDVADILSGLAEDDILQGGGGDDALDGGQGSDTASYETATSGVSVYLQYDGRNVGGEAGRDTFTSIENLTGSSFDDRLIGDSGDNILTGGTGGDILKGKGGNDTFFGGDGDDVLRGGDGIDIMHGGAGSDILFALSGADILNGGDGRDFLYGGRDADIVNGDAGDDEVRGNLGNDEIFGGAGRDDLRGGGSNDQIDGGADGDFLFGGNGADTLNGGAGNDALTGGSGAGALDGTRDTFVFSDTGAGGGGFDRIKDWEDGIDRIDLSSFGFGDFTTDVLSRASDSNGNLRLDFGGGDVLFVETFAFSDFDQSDVILS